jgi:hypothetical protein
LCRRLLYLTGFLLIASGGWAQQQFSGGGNGCLNSHGTLISINNSGTSGTSSVQIVALSGTAKIYVCSLTVLQVSGTSPTFSLTSGTGTACATGTAVMVFPFTGSTTTPSAFANPVGVTAAGAQLCYIQTGTSPVYKFVLTYVQQ